MRPVRCFDCPILYGFGHSRKIMLRGNLTRAVRRHFINVHGPEIAPGVFANAVNNCVEFIDRKAQRLRAEAKTE